MRYFIILKIVFSTLFIQYSDLLGQIHLNKSNVYFVGDSLFFEFQLNDNIQTRQIHCSSGFGSLMLNSEQNDGKLFYHIPQFMTNKIGEVSWYIIENDILIGEGVIFLKSKLEISKIETYLGPPSILAGGRDFSMFVSIPTDVFDNPLPDLTWIELQYLTENQTIHDTLMINNGLVYKRIYSPIKSGKVFLSSFIGNVSSDEYEIVIQPNLPINFTIKSEFNHLFADGNQEINFNTSILKDTFNNVVSDGTMVEFFIETQSGNVLRTRGVTVNGIANAKILHPDISERWKVKALVMGMAESNVLNVTFNQVIKGYDVNFSNNNRKIILGPLTSYLNQLIPDGFKAELTIKDGNVLVNKELKYSQDGMIEFSLSPHDVKPGTYTLVFNVSGVEYVYEHIKL